MPLTKPLPRVTKTGQIRFPKLAGEKAARAVAPHSVEKMCKDLDSMLRLARRQKHPAAGVGAIMGKAKLLGLIVEKGEGTDATAARRPMREPTENKEMSMEEWTKKFAPKMPETRQ